MRYVRRINLSETNWKESPTGKERLGFYNPKSVEKIFKCAFDTSTSSVTAGTEWGHHAVGEPVEPPQGITPNCKLKTPN